MSKHGSNNNGVETLTAGDLGQTNAGCRPYDFEPTKSYKSGSDVGGRQDAGSGLSQARRDSSVVIQRALGAAPCGKGFDGGASTGGGMKLLGSRGAPMRQLRHVAESSRVSGIQVRLRCRRVSTPIKAALRVLGSEGRGLRLDLSSFRWFERVRRALTALATAFDTSITARWRF